MNDLWHCSGVVAGLRQGWASSSPKAVQTTAARAKLKACFGGFRLLQTARRLLIFFAPVFGKKNQKAGAKKCIKKRERTRVFAPSKKIWVAAAIA